MYDLRLGAINRALVKAIKLNAACRRMVGPKSEALSDLVAIDLEVRAAAAECQRVLALITIDLDRPMLTSEAPANP